MATKTDRILSYLPRTFRISPHTTALYAVVDSFGNELLNGENSLAALMSAHWVDHADRNAEIIKDLTRIAALYGLAPRADENVEEFRQHLKRYILTFLEGTVTVQGILRVVADVFGLQILDDVEELDGWWKRNSNELISIMPARDDAAELLFGFKEISATGQAEATATFVSKVDLSAGIDLREFPDLCLKTDDNEAVNIYLTSAAADPSRVSLDEMITAINDALAAEIAVRENNVLKLLSPTCGADSLLEIRDAQNDAAQAVLGLPPRRYAGSDIIAAKVTGSVDLAGGADLSENHFIRLMIDDTYLAEIDCAGANPAQTTIDEIQQAINSALAIDAASNDGRFITLTSPSPGSAASIAFQTPAAQNATELIFGKVNTVYTEQDAAPAVFRSNKNLSAGIDLSKNNKIQLRINDGASLVINCSGADPADTQIEEIVSAINAAAGVPLASHNVRFISLKTSNSGKEAEIVFETPPDSEATELIFGILPRSFSGSNAQAAIISGINDLSGGVNVWAKRFLKMAVDSNYPRTIDFCAVADDPRNVSLNELCAIINTSFGQDIARHDGQYLTLISQRTGLDSSLVIHQLENIQSRYFTTRAFIKDEAAYKIFGFISAEAKGVPATKARIPGKTDLSRGVNLSEKRYLRLIVDSLPATDIDCAGKRPRATTLEEILQAVNSALEKAAGQELKMPIAESDGKQLTLTSSTTGANSKIAFETPRPFDASEILLGVMPAVSHGKATCGIHFISTVDLSQGIELPANAAIKLGVDDKDPLEISFTADNPEMFTLSRLVIAINLALDLNVASHDGIHLLLDSPISGIEARIRFELPGGLDVTRDLFGISPPRDYKGKDALPGRIEGQSDLSAGVDLRERKLINLSVDGASFAEIDCSAKAADPAAATADEIALAINEQFPQEVATIEAGRLVLQSIEKGVSSKIEFTYLISADAREILFGDVENPVQGNPAAPAIITGEVELLKPVDLSQRAEIRLSVDGERAVDIDVSGPSPSATYLDEIVEAVNKVYPNSASATKENKLQICSPSAGAESSLSLQAMRCIEIIEYPPQDEIEKMPSVGHGDMWRMDNPGAKEVFAGIKLTAPEGVVGAKFFNLTANWFISLNTVLNAGELMHIRRDAEGKIVAGIYADNEKKRNVPSSKILAGPIGSQSIVPYAGWQRLSQSLDFSNTLQLNNPASENIIELRARTELENFDKIEISVSTSALPEGYETSQAVLNAEIRLIGRINTSEAETFLLDKNGETIAELRTGVVPDMAEYNEQAVLVSGTVAAIKPMVVIVQIISALFDVTLRDSAQTAEPLEEFYGGVTIGAGCDLHESLTRQVNIGPNPSKIVKAQCYKKADVLALSRGRTEWLFMLCRATRFNQANFDEASFNGGGCTEKGVFNASRFADEQAEAPLPAFASLQEATGETVEIGFNWQNHRVGAFQVNLPAELPERFGARFNESYFSQQGDAPELYADAVTEPPDDEDYIVTLINNESAIVEAAVVSTVPLGWAAIKMPFRKPRFFTGGDKNRQAKIYLSEEGIDGVLELKARKSGAWGNKISVAARPSGPALFDVTINFEGGRFENARQIALGAPLSELGSELTEPAPIGVLQAKAAGIQASVSRDGLPAVSG